MEDSIKPTDSAFPSFAEINGREVVGSNGINVRQYFAAAALQGLLAHHGAGLFDQFTTLREAAETRAEQAFAFADALIAESAR